MLPVERRASMPYAQLKAEYLDRGVPVILTDFVRDWAALQRWTPEFFRENYGDREVDVYDESFQQPGARYLEPFGKMRFGEYLDLIASGPTRVRLFLFDLFAMAPELRGDIHLPEWQDWLSRRVLMTFFGGSGGVTTFHYDVDLPHVFHVLIHGRKEFYLYAPDQASRLYRHPWTVRSYVDIKHPDLRLHPRFLEAEGRHCILEAGEMLVIPSRQWHQVFYPEVSWGLAFRKYEARNVPEALYNMLVQEPIDRVLTWALGERWFQRKDRRSRAAG